MRAVNLIRADAPRAGRTRRPGRRALLAICSALAVLIALAAGAVVSGRDAAEKRQTLETLRAELTVIRARTAPETNARVANEAKQRLSALEAALAGRVAWDRLLRRISLVLPDDVWLSGLTAKAPAAAAPAAAAPASTGTAPPAPGATQTGFTLKGYTYSHDAVARFLVRLALIPELTNVQLQKSGRTKVADRPLVEFVVSADVRPPGATS